MSFTFIHPIIGQEAVCPDGLGRVTAFRDRFPEQWIEVSTYVNDRKRQWAIDNVEIVILNPTKPVHQFNEGENNG